MKTATKSKAKLVEKFQDTGRLVESVKRPRTVKDPMNVHFYIVTCGWNIVMVSHDQRQVDQFVDLFNSQRKRGAPEAIIYPRCVQVPAPTF